MSDPITIPEVKTIAEVERIVNGSGLWDGTGEVEFSDDGITWTAAWTPDADGAHPQFARVSVYRKEVRIPTTVTIRWDEQFPEASGEWAGKWLRSPMRHFGRTVRMVGYRQTFRELLGNVRIEDEADDRVTESTAIADSTSVAEQPAEPIDWAAAIAGATTLDEINDVDAAARAARVFKPNAEGTALHKALTDRRREITAAAWSPVTPGESADLDIADGARVTAERIGKAEPRDYLPPAGNRADRRAAARKRGRRR
ncbi:hypothetical protein [Microbacterium sp. USHLN272]|uniref:hypothetical protein n=1 Tax=Microbacterium sp. USHLN272 TaxID=3081287 RepID=UPI0030164886